jgi:hypothetical protein
MGAQVLLINPAKRRRSKRRHAKKRSRARRPMTALQMKYFGGGRKRRSSRRRATLHANPRRRIRRNPSRKRQRGYARAGGARLPRISFNFSAIQSAAKSAAIGASGALAVDVLMGQAGRVLPDTWLSRFNADGSVNWPYYLAKMGIAVGVGVLGAKFARGYAGVAQQMALGSITVQSYELLRSFVPADMVTLGYYSPARVAQPMAGMRGRLGYYENKPGNTMPRFGTTLARLRGMSRIGGGRIG